MKTNNKSNASNKEKIFSIAIELFAQKGYMNVTLREIAGAVGIKAASIYNHYKSKESILEEIVEVLQVKLHQNVYPAFENFDHSSIQEYIEAITKANDGFFSVPLHAQIGLIVLREQFQSEKIRNMLLEDLILQPRKLIATFFEKMMDSGKMRLADPIFLAKEYHSYFIYEFYENSLSQRFDTPDKRVQFEHDQHIKFFLEAWSVVPLQL